MLILIRSSTRQKLYLLLRLLIIIALVGLIIFQLSGLFKGYTFSSGDWLKEDNPSGNSMRVEGVSREKAKADKKKDKTREGINKKDFYHKAP